MSKEKFYTLLSRYSQGQCSDAEKKIIEQWYGLLDDESLPSLSDDELTNIDARLQAALDEHLSEDRKAMRRRKIQRWTILSIAAAFIGLLVMVNVMTAPISGASFLSDTENIIVYTNEGNRSVKVALPDQSEVILQPHATIQYPNDFPNDLREVHLTGDAFFSVTHNKTKPFLVYSNNLITQVLGTSFMVKASDQEIVVRTGKVNVQQNTEKSFMKKWISKPEQVTLLPNQSAVLDDQHRFNLSQLKEPVCFHRVGQFNFVDTPLSEVFAAISEAYAMPVITKKATFNGCTFTGDLTEDPLSVQLQFICRTMGLTYSLGDTSIVVEGKACRP